MTQPQTKPEWQRAVIAMSASVVFALVVTTVYWARSIFIPVALAVFLTFVLSPVVRRLEGWKLGRLPAVLGTVGLAICVFGLVGWLVTRQLSELTDQLPENSKKIAGKVADVRRAILGDGNSQFGKMMQDIQEAISPSAPEAGDPTLRPESMGAVGGAVSLPEVTARTPATSQPIFVTQASASARPGPAWMSHVEGLVSPLMELIGQTAFAFVLSVFMLLKREDLRNKLIRLIGPTQITTTTKAVDDASKRVSRFLLAQLAINSTAGVVITLALLVIGVPYAFVWGFLAAVMRYVPYIGTWIGLIPPVIVSLALNDEGWQPIAVACVYGAIELACNNIFEPWLYGSSMGLSEVAQLVAAAFWTFLWGPIGLVLSGPLTVCLLVLGKYVPRFEFLEVLLGDEPALDPDVRFYQRLTAHDEDEAAAILAEQVANGVAPEVVADSILIPALAMARRDVEQAALGKDDARVILQSVRELTEDLAEAGRHEAAPDATPVRLLALPARDEADRVGLEVFRGLLDTDRWEVEIAAVESLTSELMEQVARFKPAVICVSALPPGGLAHTRYLCKRLRKQFPDVHIVVGRWGLQEDVDQNREQLTAAGVDHITASLAEMKHYLREWQPVLDNQQKAASGSAGKSNGRARVGTPAAT
jgi:predicted PurR-regulated permease PerM